MPHIKANGLRLYYEIKGQGPRLLWLTGTGADLRRTPSPFTTKMPERFEVLALDQRGLGQSDKPDGPYTVAQYADDAAALLDALGWAKCHVMGVSFGGMVAQELAINHPTKIEKLVLCCCSTGGPGGSSYPLHELEHLPLEEKMRLRVMRTDKRQDAHWIDTHPAEYKALFDKGVADARLFADEPRRKEGAAWQLDARARHDTYHRLDKIRMPVLVCGGKYDGQAESPVVEELARRIPGTQLKFFEGGHGFLNQDPAALAAITAFLQ